MTTAPIRKKELAYYFEIKISELDEDDGYVLIDPRNITIGLTEKSYSTSKQPGFTKQYSSSLTKKLRSVFRF